MKLLPFLCLWRQLQRSHQVKCGRGKQIGTIQRYTRLIAFAHKLLTNLGTSKHFSKCLRLASTIEGPSKLVQNDAEPWNASIASIAKIDYHFMLQIFLREDPVATWSPKNAPNFWIWGGLKWNSKCNILLHCRTGSELILNAFRTHSERILNGYGFERVRVCINVAFFLWDRMGSNGFERLWSGSNGFEREGVGPVKFGKKIQKIYQKCHLQPFPNYFAFEVVPWNSTIKSSRYQFPF